MSIQNTYDETVRVDRLQATESGDAGEEDYGVHINNLQCTIQPLDESFTEDITGQFGKDWTLYCNIADILEGDRIVNGDDEYRVVGVETFPHEMAGDDAHMELRIREYND
jgi:hypothetical protein